MKVDFDETFFFDENGIDESGFYRGIVQASHIQNFFRMFFVSFLSDVEHILNVLESCVFEDFQILLEIRSKMNGGFHR